MKKVLFLVVLILASLSNSVSAQNTRTVRIGIILDGPSILVDDILGLVQQETFALTKDEFDIQFPEDKTIIADWTLKNNKKAITQLLNDDSVDIVLTLGVISTSDVIQRGRLNKPVIATPVLDAKVQNAPQKDNSSGVKNLSYTAIASDFEQNIEESQKHANAKLITVLTNRTIDIAIPNLNSRLKKNLQSLGATVELLSLSDSIEDTLNKIDPQTDIVLVAHQTFLSMEEKLQIVNGLIDRKLPSFAMAGKSEVELGFLMSSGQDSIDIKRLSRRIALNLQRILLGENPSDLPIFFTKKKQMTINMETAKKIGFSPSFDMLENAQLINENFKIADSLSLFEAIQKSVDSNLNLAVKGKEVAAGAQDIKKAWAKLLPQISLSNAYTDIDEDRAVAAQGGAPQRTAAASATLNQVIFSEQTFANVSIQKNSQASLESELDELRLDIIQATFAAYLNVLRTMRIESIQINNLELSRSNLDLAQTRKKVGESSSSDVYRWESEIANNQKDILTAKANRKNAQLALNRLIHVNLRKDFDYEDFGLKNKNIFLDAKIPDYIDNPYAFNVLSDFMVEEGLRAAPELKQIQSLIKVKRRQLQSSQRDFWIPEVSLQATLSDNYYEGGAGIAQSTKNDRDFTTVVKATYPLFEGGDKLATTKQTRLEIEQLEKQLEAVKEQIAEEIRMTMENIGSSYGSIKWSKKAAESATKNLKLVQDSYSEGAVDITVLLDAQNASLNADQVAENAIYDFLIDYSEFQRAIRTFYFQTPAQEKTVILKRFKQYFKDNDIEL